MEEIGFYYLNTLRKNSVTFKPHIFSSVTHKATFISRNSLLIAKQLTFLKEKTIHKIFNRRKTLGILISGSTKIEISDYTF